MRYGGSINLSIIFPYASEYVVILLNIDIDYVNLSNNRHISLGPYEKVLTLSNIIILFVFVYDE